MLGRLLRGLPIIFWQMFRFAFICFFIGPLAFLGGQLLPRQSFDYRAFPYRPFRWEQGGMVYTKLNIQRWKDKVPDMSQYIKSAFRKKIGVFRSPEYITELILETCVAEFVHWMLLWFSPVFLLLIEGVWGVLAMILYIAGNLPFIIIQRYNRPRLVTLVEKQLARRRALAASAQA